MGSADVKLAAKQKRFLIEMFDGKRKEKSYGKEVTAICSKLILLSSSNRGGSDSECDDIATSVVQEANLQRRRPAKSVVTPQLAMALDRTKVTDRSAIYVLSKTVGSIGQTQKNSTYIVLLFNVCAIVIRKSLAGSLKAEFQANDLLYLARDRHFLKLLAPTAFTTIMGSNVAPEVLPFKPFRAK